MLFICIEVKTKALSITFISSVNESSYTIDLVMLSD